MWNTFEASATDDESIVGSFYTNGLFKIVNEEKSNKNAPRVSARIQDQKILVAVDNSLVLIENENDIECKFLSLASQIECIAVSKSGDLVICCLADGNIHGIHIKGSALFNMNIQDEDVNLLKTFLDITLVNDDFYIMCTNGKLYKLYNLEESAFSQSVLESSTRSVSNETLMNATLDRITNTKYSNRLNAFCYVETWEGSLNIISGEEYIYFQTNEQISKVKYPASIKPIKKILNLENYILGLTTDGEFLEICPVQKVFYKMQGCKGNNLEPIDDLVVLEANDESIELLTLSKPTADKMRTMKIIDFPSFQCKYEMLIPEVAWLVPQAKLSANMYFVHGSLNDDGFVQAIEMKMISEAEPSQRLKKLIQRGLFFEAENFAKQFDLDLQLIYEAKVKKALMEISTITKPDDLEQHFNNLMALLKDVTSSEFLVSIRLSEIPERNFMTKYLEYLIATIDTNQYQLETNEINELMLRLETLRIIDPSECNLDWQKFLHHGNMAYVAQNYFKTDVLLSCFIWSRHSSSILPDLDLPSFRKWLTAIPNIVEPFQIIQWLKHFVPCFLQAYPNEMNLLVQWTVDRVRMLQFSNSWPEIGLEFGNKILSVFADIKFMFVDINRLYSSNIEKIQSYIFALEELCVLKMDYHLTLTLDEYMKESIEETAFRLLQRIQLPNLKKMVNLFLYPIFTDRGLMPEDVIVKYIKFLTSNKNMGYWQERAVLAVDLLHLEENKMQCALLVLKVSPVPWSDAVNPLIILGSSSHPLANSIFIEFKSQAIKMIKVKYNWPLDYFDLHNDRMKLVFRILKLSKPDMIQDIHVLVKSSPDIAADAYHYLINRLTELGDFEKCIEVIENVEDKNELCMRSVGVFVAKLDRHEVEQKDLENYLEIVKFLFSRILKPNDESSYRNLKMKVESLKNVLLLRSEFGFDANLVCLSSVVTKASLLNAGIFQTIEELKREPKEETGVGFVWRKMQILTQCLQHDFLSGIHQLCKELGSLHFTCGLADVLLQSMDLEDNFDCKAWLDIAVLILVQQIKFFDEDKELNEFYDPLAFPLMHKLAVSCLPHANYLQFDDVVEIIRWAEIGKAFYDLNVIESTRSKRVITKEIFKSNTSLSGFIEKENRRESFSVFDKVDEVQPIKNYQENENLQPVLRCICSAIKLLLIGLKLTTGIFRRIIHMMKNINYKDSQKVHDEFSAGLEGILKLRQYNPSFATVQHILRHQKTCDIVVLPPTFVSNLNKRIIKFMLSQKEPVHMEAFIVLKAETNREECLAYLKSVLVNQSQRMAFSTFRELYNNYTDDSQNVIEERETRLKYYYFGELCKLDPAYKNRCNLDTAQLTDLIKDLRKYSLEVDMLKKMSNDFNWDFQQVLMSQIKVLINRQVFEFDIKTDVFGKDEVVVKSSVDDIKKLCAPYLNEITNIDLMATKLQAMLPDFNFYFYELYLVVIDMLEQINNLPDAMKLWRNMLLFLKFKMTTKRINRIGQTESDYWLKKQPEVGVLPSISKYRLPFMPLVESQESFDSILNAELCADNFERWLPLIRLHATLAKISITERQDTLCMCAIKNSIAEFKPADKKSEWNLTPINNGFLQLVLRLTTYMQAHDRVLVVLYFVMNHAPEGADQVEAAYECFQYATKHEKLFLTSEKSQGVLARIKRKYPIVKTQHLLHLYGFKDEKLFQLIESPTELLTAIYNHECLLKPQKRDINKLAAELANLYKINLSSVQLRLLQKWLAFAPIDQDHQELNETVYEDFITTAQDPGQITTNEEHVARAHYILSSWQQIEAFEFLASELSSNAASANQLQLYECFAKLMDANNTSYLDVINSNNYLHVKCCYFLKQLGMSYTMDKFKAADKVSILKKIWTSHNSNPIALEVMCYICLGYDIHLPQIWNGVLKQMVALNMISLLSSLVDVLSTKSNLLHLAGLKSAWECVIREPFKNATRTKSYEEDEKLAKAFVLLQKCPISTYLSLLSFAEECLRLNRPAMAAIFLAYVKGPEKEKMKKLVKPHCNGKLKAEIIELEDLGVPPVITKSVINFLGL